MISKLLEVVSFLIGPGNRDYVIGDLLELWEEDIDSGRRAATATLIGRLVWAILLEETGRWKTLFQPGSAAGPRWSPIVLGSIGILAFSLNLTAPSGLHPLVRELDALPAPGGPGVAEAAIVLQADARLEGAPSSEVESALVARQALLLRLDPELLSGRLPSASPASDRTGGDRRIEAVRILGPGEGVTSSADLLRRGTINGQAFKVVGSVRLPRLSEWGIEGASLWVIAEPCPGIPSFSLCG